MQIADSGDINDLADQRQRRTGTLQPLQSRIQNLRNVVASSAAIPVYKQCCSLVGARQPLTARKRVRLIDWQSEHLSKSRRLSKTRMMKVFPIEAVVQQGDGAKEGEIGSPFPQLVDSTPTDYSTGCVRWDDNSRIRASSAVSGVMCL